MDGTELPVRLAGRVIPIDPAGRVLLFRYDDPPPKGPHWATPGGGIEAGEDYYAAARRELTEETGWTDVPVAPGEVHQESTVQWAGEMRRMVRQHDHYFVARVAVAERPLGEVAAMHVSDGSTSALVDARRAGRDRAGCVPAGTRGAAQAART